MNLWMLFIALVTLGVLAWQEYRHWRDRPKARITIDAIGWVDIDGERWELIDVSNIGDRSALIFGHVFVGLTVLTKLQEQSAIVGRLPKVLQAESTVRLAVQGDLDTAWLWLTFAPQGLRRYVTSWRPVGGYDSLGGRVWFEQSKAQDAREKSRWKPRVWAKDYWRNLRRRPRPIGPYVGGDDRWVVKRGPRLSTASGVPEDIRIASGQDVVPLDGFEGLGRS